MPTYSYRCSACGFEFERVQRISEDPIKDCPQCNKSEARRQITSANFILKGGGWYNDLYSGGSNKKATAAADSATTAAAGATATGTSAKDTGATGTAAPAAPAATASTSSTPSSTPATTPPPAK